MTKRKILRFTASQLIKDMLKQQGLTTIVCLINDKESNIMTSLATNNPEVWTSRTKVIIE